MTGDNGPGSRRTSGGRRRRHAGSVLNPSMHTILTIGHSNHPLEAFLNLLRRHDVKTLADVRSVPYSRYYPQFRRRPLQQALAARGIDYVFLGRELGARPTETACYRDGRVDYERLARTARFIAGIDRLVREAETRCVAVLCAEREPLDCHRTILVAPALTRRGASVAHILRDGGLEPHAAALDRLLDLVGLPPHDLLRPRDQAVADALSRRGQQIAYARKAPGANART